MSKKILEINQLDFFYNKGLVDERHILKNITFSISEKEFIALIGPSGSGKTTLVKHLNGLLKASGGDILYLGDSIYRKKFNMSTLRKNVGIVFQYPEHQLFRKTVLDDVAFGPINMGLSKENAMSKAIEALETVGISKDLYNHNPFELSGGQMRCAAIAGILSMEPKVIILDEPAAGLDPGIKVHIFDILKNINEKTNTSIVIVSHDMEDVAEYTKRVLVMNDGNLIFDTTPKELFNNLHYITTQGTSIPFVTEVGYELKNAGIPLSLLPINVEEAIDIIDNALKDKI